MRTYIGFARRSPVPERLDGLLTTPRNAPPLVNASLDRPGGALFPSMQSLHRSRISLPRPLLVVILGGCQEKGRKRSVISPFDVFL